MVRDGRGLPSDGPGRRGVAFRWTGTAEGCRAFMRLCRGFASDRWLPRHGGFVAGEALR